MKEAAARFLLAYDEARRIRHFTIPMLRDEFGVEWPDAVGQITRQADMAADALRPLLTTRPEAKRG